MHSERPTSDMVTDLLRVAPGRVLFELGGAPIREELAREGTSVLIVYALL